MVVIIKLLNIKVINTIRYVLEISFHSLWVTSGRIRRRNFRLVQRGDEKLHRLFSLSNLLLLQLLRLLNEVKPNASFKHCSVERLMLPYDICREESSPVHSAHSHRYIDVLPFRCSRSNFRCSQENSTFRYHKLYIYIFFPSQNIQTNFQLRKKKQTNEKTFVQLTE